MADETEQKSHHELVRERNVLGTALAESERITAGILSAVPAGVVHVEATGAIRNANDEALRVLGLGFDELTQKYTVDFETETIFEDGSPCTNADYPVTKALLTGEPQGATTIGVKRPDGEVSWCIFRAVPVKDDAGSTTGAIVTITDITQRKKAEEERTNLLVRLNQAERLEALGRLAGGVAHDFNNLLTLILGGLELHEKRSEEPIPSHLCDMRTAARQAANLTRQLLAFGRRQALAPTVFNLADVVQSMEPMLRRLAGDAVGLEVHCDDDTFDIHADANELERVVVNLVANARDAVEVGGGSVEVGVERVVIGDDDDIPPGRYTALTVSDDGPGIDPEALPHIFEPFFTTKAGEGTGLGLATVHGIVTQSGGHLSVGPSDAGGASFRVLLPATDQAPTPAPEPSTLPSRPPEGHKVLLVEDDAAVRKVVRLLLGELGYEVVDKESADAALAMTIEELQSCALLITDVVMPEQTGPELAEALAARVPSLPVLFMSGHLQGQKAILPPGAKLLPKPFTADQLFEVVRTILDQAVEEAPEREPE